VSEANPDSDWESELIEDMAGMWLDPYAFVLYAFPWGEPGELENHKGPREWQAKILKEIGEELRANNLTRVNAIIQEAVASGHGIGKSALVAWLILWAMSTMEDTRGVVTANTDTQLRTKTVAEATKWHRLCITKHWFKMTATAIFSNDPEHEKTWRIDFIPNSPHSSEGFAGLHNQTRTLIIFDEASAIENIIWETTQGALTDENSQIIFAAFGNPTRTGTRFHQCFTRYRHRWNTHHVDSSQVEGTNKELIQSWMDDYGADSDFVKVRVLGQFPSQSDMQFIGAHLAEAAQDRQVHHAGASLVMGVDVARYGDDRSVIYFRRGRDAASQKRKVYRGISLMQLADYVAEDITTHRPATVFIDGTGVGGGVVDRLEQLGYGHVIVEVNAGESATDSERYKNKRAEMWAEMKEWLKVGSIPNDQVLFDDLTGLEYQFDMQGRLQLEKKEDMKKRGLASPDIADALALTFAEPVAPEEYAHKPVRVKRAMGR